MHCSAPHWSGLVIGLCDEYNECRVSVSSPRLMTTCLRSLLLGRLSSAVCLSPLLPFLTNKKTPAFWPGFLSYLPGGALLSHGEAPHYHRHFGVSLLSSVWGQVGPPLYRRQDYSVLDFRPWTLALHLRLRLRLCLCLCRLYTLCALLLATS